MRKNIFYIYALFSATMLLLANCTDDLQMNPDRYTNRRVLDRHIRATKVQPNSCSFKVLNRAQYGGEHNYKTALWPRGVIPYYIDSENLGFIELVRRSMDIWQERTKNAIVFVNDPRKDMYPRRVKVSQSTTLVGAYATMGNNPHVPANELVCNFGLNPKMKTVLHELGHIIGFTHEHQINDSKKYILFSSDAKDFLIKERGISKQHLIKENYLIRHVSYLNHYINTDNYSFDRTSIMLYGSLLEGTKNASFQNDFKKYAGVQHGFFVYKYKTSGGVCKELTSSLNLSDQDIARVKELYRKTVIIKLSADSELPSEYVRVKALLQEEGKDSYWGYYVLDNNYTPEIAFEVINGAFYLKRMYSSKNSGKTRVLKVEFAQNWGFDLEFSNKNISMNSYTLVENLGDICHPNVKNRPVNKQYFEDNTKNIQIPIQAMGNSFLNATPAAKYNASGWYPFFVTTQFDEYPVKEGMHVLHASPTAFIITIHISKYTTSSPSGFFAYWLKMSEIAYARNVRKVVK